MILEALCRFHSTHGYIYIFFSEHLLTMKKNEGTLSELIDLCKSYQQIPFLYEQTKPYLAFTAKPGKTQLCYLGSISNTQLLSITPNFLIISPVRISLSKRGLSVSQTNALLLFHRLNILDFLRQRKFYQKDAATPSKKQMRIFTKIL